MAKHVLATARLVDRYSDAKHARVAGKHLESLVKMQLRASQFEIVGEHTAEYDGKEWDETNHNLGFVARRKGKDLAIGVEVKNTPGCMRAGEIDIKIDICKDLEIVPVFAVRWIKPYIECMRKQGGFSWIFKVRMFPLGYEEFVGNVRRRLSVGKSSGRRANADAGTKRLFSEYPVTVRTELPEKPVAKFDEWVARVDDDPPAVDTSYGCTPRARRWRGAERGMCRRGESSGPSRRAACSKAARRNPSCASSQREQPAFPPPERTGSGGANQAESTAFLRKAAMSLRTDSASSSRALPRAALASAICRAVSSRVIAPCASRWPP